MKTKNKVYKLTVYLFVTSILTIIPQFALTYDKPLALYLPILTIVFSISSFLVGIISLIIRKQMTIKVIRIYLMLILINIIIVLLMIGNIYFLFRYRAGNIYI